MFDAAYQRGLVLYRQQRYEMAADEFRRALAEQPSHASAHSMLALCLLMRGKLDDAEPIGRAALETNPNNAFSHYAMAHILKRKAARQYTGKHFYSASYRTTVVRELLAPALFHTSESLRIDPNNAEYLLLVGEIEANCERLDTALMAVETGLSHNPQHIGCANMRAYLLRRMGRFVEAKQTGARTLEIDPERPETHVSHGMTLLQTDDPSAAFEHFKEALRLDPTDQQTRTNLIAAAKARYRVHNYFATRKPFPLPFLAIATVFFIAVMFGMGTSPETVNDPDAPKLQLLFSCIYLVIVALSPQMLTLLLRRDPDVANALTEKLRISNNLVLASTGLVWIVGMALALGGRCAALFAVLALPGVVPMAVSICQPTRRRQRVWLSIAIVLLAIGTIVGALQAFWPNEAMGNVAAFLAVIYMVGGLVLFVLYTSQLL